MKKLNKKNLNLLTQEEMDLIEIMFWGPYKTEWYTKKGIVDNRDSEIAKRIGVSTVRVSEYTDKISKEHFKRVLIINNSK